MFIKLIKRILPTSIRHKIIWFLRKVILKILGDSNNTEFFLIAQRLESLESKVILMTREMSTVKYLFQQKEIIDKIYTKCRIMQDELQNIQRPAQNDREQLDSYSDSIFSDEEYDAYETSILKGRLEAQEAYFDELIRECKDGAYILDLGCGKGGFIDRVNQSGRTAVGIDINKKYATHKNIVHGRLPELLYEYAPQSFDYIYSFHLVEHMSDIALRKMLEESYRLLRDGGRIFIETPNTQSLYTLSNYYYRDPTHLQPRHPDLYKELLELAGFDKCEMRFLDELDKLSGMLPGSNLSADETKIPDVINSHFERIYNLLYAGSSNILMVGEKSED